MRYSVVFFNITIPNSLSVPAVPQLVLGCPSDDRKSSSIVGDRALLRQAAAGVTRAPFVRFFKYYSKKQPSVHTVPQLVLVCRKSSSIVGDRALRRRAAAGVTRASFGRFF